MEQNRLQTELDLRRSSGDAELIDLSDTNFHANGLRFPDSELRLLFEDYLTHRDYRPDPKGALGAREAVSEYYADRGIDVPPEHIIITASTSEAYSLLFSSLSAVGDNVVLPNPTYPLFEYLAEFSRLEARYYRMRYADAFKIDIDSIVRHVDDRTRFVVLISPNNPTGQIAEIDEVDALLHVCEETGTMLISDEVFSEMYYEGFRAGKANGVPRPAQRGSPVPVFTLNGISKMFASPDLKLGWIAVSGDSKRLNEPIDRLEIANDTFLSCTGLAQHLLPQLFKRGGTFTREMRETLQGNRDQLLRSLGAEPRPGVEPAPSIPISGEAGLRIVPPTGGIHAVVGIPRSGAENWSDDEGFAVQLLRSHGLYVHPGYFYGLDDGVDEIYVVISFLKERGVLAKGLSRLVSFVSGAPGRDD